MKKVRWGLCSTAHINRRLIPAIRSSSRGELTAIASRDQKNADEYAKKWNIPYAFASYQAMIDSGRIDVVYISLPNHLHAHWTIRSLEAGLHVLCEKPIAINLDDVDAMIAASDRTGGVLAEAFMYRHHPQTKIAGDLCRSGRLGRIILVRSSFNFQIEESHWIRLVPEYGGGSLWDIGIYPVSLAQYMLGSPPDWVAGVQSLGNSGVDESFAGLMHYPGDAIALISCSFRSPFHTFAEITGTRGRLFLYRPFTGIDVSQPMLFYPENGETEEIAVPAQELYLGEVEDMHSAILDGNRPYLTLEETRNHIKTALALYRSAQIGAQVSL